MRKYYGLFVCLMVLAGATAAFAAGTDAAAAAPLWKGILNGAIAGVAAAAVGWLKNRNAATGEMEKPDIKYIVPTVVIGAIMGVLAGWQNKDLGSFTGWVETTPFVVIAEMIWKVIFRNTTPMVREALAAIKGGAANPTSPAAP